MKRIALRVGRASAVLASAGVLLAASCGESSLAHSAPAGRDSRPPSTIVLESTCLYPSDRDLAAPARVVVPDGTAVDLWCGSRIEVSEGWCRARIGTLVEPVACVEAPRPSGSRGASLTPSHDALGGR